MEYLRNIISADTGTDPAFIQLVPVAAGASSKNYYRVSGLDNIYGCNLLVMQAPQNTVSDFVDVTRIFTENNIRSPLIFRHNVAHGYVIIEDCGDLTLEQLVKTASLRESEEYYKQALDILISIQSCIPDPASIIASRYFDKEKFLFEYRFHFRDKLIHNYLGYTLNKDEEKVFDDFFNNLAIELSKQPQVPVHRDFQSSNLIYMDPIWVVIDHQDARMGPPLYDLVSLIEDVYVSLDVPTKEQLRSYYQDTAGKKGLPLPSPDRFARIYDLVTIQRKLHDAGAFYFCFENFGNIKYLSYIKPALQQALDIMSRYSEFAVSFEILTMISHAYHTKKQVR